MKSHLTEGAFIYCVNNPLRFSDSTGFSAGDKVFNYSRAILKAGAGAIIGTYAGILGGAITGGVIGGSAGGILGGIFGAILGGFVGCIGGFILGLIIGFLFDKTGRRILSWIVKKIGGKILDFFSSIGEKIVNWFASSPKRKNITTRIKSELEYEPTYKYKDSELVSDPTHISSGKLSEIIMSGLPSPQNEKHSSESMGRFSGILQGVFGTSHFLGPLFPGINGLSIDLDFTFSLDPTNDSEGAVKVFVPGFGGGYSYFSKEQNFVFSIGTASSEIVSHFSNMVSQPFSGVKAGVYFGMSLSAQF
jgi:hypothetical protein